MTYDIAWGDGTQDTVNYALCRGTGRYIGTRFRTFRCYVETDEDSPYWVSVRTAWTGNAITFLYYN